MIRIATRKSPLALWQAEYIKQQLLDHHPDLAVEIVAMTTEGDRHLETQLNKIGGKGLFIKELETSLLIDKADIAVHSMKDMTVDLVKDFVIAAICQRAEPRDAFVSNEYNNLDQVPAGSVIGTSSLRRCAQLMSVRPDLKIKSLRGNVNTRLRKLDEGEFAAILLAAAGLQRLGFSERISSYLSEKQFIPAVAQAAIGIEVRSDKTEILDLVKPLNHLQTSQCVLAERAMNKQLDGGCHVPVAGFAQIIDDSLQLNGMVASTDGKVRLQAYSEGKPNDFVAIGESVAEKLMQQGADKILREFV